MRRETVTRGHAIGALAAAVLMPQADAGAQTSELTAIRVASAPNDQVTPLLYGIDAGLFHRTGLDVSVMQMRSGAEIIGAVVGGSLDMGSSDVISTMTAHSKGLPIVLVAPNVYYDPSNPNVGVVVSASSPIRSARDLLGKTVAVNALRNAFSLALMAWLDQNGVDPVNAVKFIEIPMASVPEGLQQGRFDAGVMSEPLLAGALTQGARIIGYPFDAFGKHSEPTAFFSSTSWVAAHHDELRRFNLTLRDAARYVSAHESSVYGLTAKFTGMTQEQVARMKPSFRALSLEPSEIQPYIDAAAKFKFIPQAFPAREFIAT